MKGRISLDFLILLVISALALYGFAQSQPDRKQDTVKATGGGCAYEFAIGKGMVLLKARIGGDGTVDYVEDPLYHAIIPAGKLHIEMLDASVQEIDLKKVKTVTIE